MATNTEGRVVLDKNLRGGKTLPTAVFALIIGINNYQTADYPSLKAAVKDADAFEQFLTGRLGVPPDNIISLRDEKATRDAIISSFSSLKDNVDIKKDESAILIYFAGHGARTEKPVGWEDWETNGSQIEMMCPTDIGTVRFTKAGEEQLTGIPDRTISVLLNHLSAMKGDNITLILDCCSSAGINRASSAHDDPENEGFVSRQIPHPPPISSDCDRNIWSHGPRSAGVALGFSGKYHESHVLLAACGREQYAWENPRTGSGLFTSKLLQILEKYSIDELTYTSLMHRLDVPRWQTPHCEGHNVHRRLFNKRAQGADGSFILGRRDKDGTFILQAGAAQGVTLHSKFAIHESNLISDSNAQLGTLILTEINPFSSVLSFIPDTKPFTFPYIFYARSTERGPEKKFAIYCADRKWIEAVISDNQADTMGVVLVDNPETADLQVSVEDGKAFFDRRDKLITPHIGTRFPHKVDINCAEEIRDIIQCAVHFDHHLARTGDDINNVWMELKKLKAIFNQFFDSTLTPTGDNLIDEEPAVVYVDEWARLGLTIFNQTDLALYPYLFYFDPSDLIIIEWYTPPFGAGVGSLSQVDAPLPPKSKLTIGYGDGGVPPWQFLLREGEDVDVGFFKLFLTTSPANFSTIAQESPFRGDTPRYGKPAPAEFPHTELWGTKMSTIVQKRSD